jgi:hypothetical protein
MPCTSNEANVLLALKALQNNKNSSLRAVAKIYNIDCITLLRRRDGKPIQRDSLVNSKKLTKSEEEAIFKYILKLDTRLFLLRLYSVEDMANQLQRVRDAPPISKL